MRGQDVGQSFAEKRQTARQHLEQHYSEAVQIAARVRFAVVNLLRTDIVGRSCAILGTGQIAWHELRARGSKIYQDQAVFVGQHEVRRLQVAVYDAGGMNDLQRLADLMRIIDGIGFADRVFQPLTQATAGEVFQG